MNSGVPRETGRKVRVLSGTPVSQPLTDKEWGRDWGPGGLSTKDPTQGVGAAETSVWVTTVVTGPLVKDGWGVGTGRDPRPLYPYSVWGMMVKEGTDPSPLGHGPVGRVDE